MANTHSLDLELGSSQFAYRADGATLSLSGDFTIEGWVKPETLASDVASDCYLVAKYLTTGNQRSYALIWLAADNKLQLNVSDDGTDDTAGGNSIHIKSTSTLTTGAWQHIAVAFDISTDSAKFYFDGTEEDGTVDAGSIGASIFDGTANFTIGARDNGSNTGVLFYDGLIDDVRVWGDIRTEAEVQDNRETETPAGDNLVGHWKLDNAYTDSSGNGLTLTASGTPAFSTDVPFVGVIDGAGESYSYIM